MNKNEPKVAEAAFASPKSITRRDFVGGTLAGTGAALLATAAPGVVRGKSAEKPGYLQVGPEWTGPGGVGDYSASNGNTHEVVNAAHSIRDGYWRSGKEHIFTGEEYDLVVIGGGFAGFMTAYECLKEKPQARVLILDNHRVFGGEAKQNEFVVDGHHLHAPQGSNGVLWPPENAEKFKELFHPVWYELGLPRGDSPEAPSWITSAAGTKKNIRFPEDHYDAIIYFRDEATQGYFFRDEKADRGYRWVKDPWKNNFKDIPWPEKAKEDWRKLESYTGFPERDNWEEWLDGMTYKEFLINEVGITSQEIFDYLNPAMAAGSGMSCDQTSALGSGFIGMQSMGQGPAAGGQEGFTNAGISLVSFPGGNASVLRHFVKKMIPDAIEGEERLRDVIYGKINFATLDHPERHLRVRLNSTAIDIRHNDSPENAKYVWVSYLDNENHTTYRVKAQAVVMASGQWINKHIIKDAPKQLQWAMNEFHYAPILVVNVAVKNWRYIEKLGISAARWFEGFGWFLCIRAPMSLDGKHEALDPDKPTVLTFYNPYTQGLADRGMSLKEHTLVAKTQLFATPFNKIEQDVRDQLNLLFGDYGFDDKKHIDGIIANRWGHAYTITYPGFFFGKNGKPAPRDIVRAGYGRIRFAHSELNGDQLWSLACHEGERAAKQILKFI